MPKFKIICDNDASQSFEVEADTIEEAGLVALEELGYWVSREYFDEEEIEERELKVDIQD